MSTIAEHAHGHGLGEKITHNSAKFGMWLFLGTEILLFGGLFAAYAIYRARYPEMFLEYHKSLDLTKGTINTFILLFSSFTMALAVLYAQRRQQLYTSIFLAITFVCGAGFGVMKYFEYSFKFEHHIYPDKNLFYAVYYMTTGLHMIHVFLGMGIILALIIMNQQGRFLKGRFTPVEVGGLYWHLVDLIWIYLFPLLYLIG
ncbi:MAG: cytochrome c oxidase subunit 3 family protein [Candidatus Dadabacteria bacterium]|nr:cytochrome c oxidase subunit 3 family protein [Candidatus Dadabacteria bacterium]NIQ14160.1 cytochrome c oxidase subunit 3 family protein [Candidatus Dadabacteria bacterium]